MNHPYPEDENGDPQGPSWLEVIIALIAYFFISVARNTYKAIAQTPRLLTKVSIVYLVLIGLGLLFIYLRRHQPVREVGLKSDSTTAKR